MAMKTCLAYLRDRIGVPRDMSFPAATQLRGHLNWAIEAM
jgi:glutathione S-transferase